MKFKGEFVSAQVSQPSSCTASLSLRYSAFALELRAVFERTFLP